MDTRIPLTPDLDGFRAKVLRPTESPFTNFHCCVCRDRLPRDGGKHGRSRICNNPTCWDEAIRLDWLIP